MFTYEIGKPQHILGKITKKQFACYLGKNKRQHEQTQIRLHFSFSAIFTIYEGEML